MRTGFDSIYAADAISIAGNYMYTVSSDQDNFVAFDISSFFSTGIIYSEFTGQGETTDLSSVGGSDEGISGLILDDGINGKIVLCCFVKFSVFLVISICTHPYSIYCSFDTSA